MIPTKQKEVIQILAEAHNSREKALGLIILLHYVSQSHFSNFTVLMLFVNGPTGVAGL